MSSSFKRWQGFRQAELPLMELAEHLHVIALSLLVKPLLPRLPR
jgi:hypothetical protein